MRALKLALRALSEHLGRTILTIIALAFFMGTLAFTLSPALYNAPLRYLGILSENGTKAIQVAADRQEKSIETFQKYFPKEHRFFPVYAGITDATETAFENRDFNSRIEGVQGLTAEDFSAMGYEAASGELPKPGEYAISLALFARLKEAGVKLRFDTSGTIETRSFETFDELKTLLAARYAEAGHGFVPAPIVLSGIVDTNFNEEKEADLTRAVETAGKKEREKAEAALQEFIGTSGTLFVFSNSERKWQNASGRYLTALPETSAERKALFKAIQSNLRAHANPYGGNKTSVEIDVIEARYDDEFYEVVTGGYAASMLTMPFAVAFGFLSILFLWSLSRACAKTSALRGSALCGGNKASGGYGVSLLRCLIPTIFAFAVSVGIAYFCRFVFATGGLADRICASLIEGWDASGRNFVDVNYFGFLPFFLSLLSGLILTLFGSVVGLRKGRFGAVPTGGGEEEIGETAESDSVG